MSLFIASLVAGFIGLALMALPGVMRHGSGAHAGHSGHAAGHGHGTHAGQTHSAQHGNKLAGMGGRSFLLWLMPNPRVLFSILAFFGAYGYVFQRGMRLSETMAALAAIVPAILTERFVVAPIFNFLLGFSGTPSTPLETLVMTSATAVTPFRNGRGIVSVDRDGREVQFRAELTDSCRAAGVRVGDTLRIEDVDSARERVTVSIGEILTPRG
jgi:hypothetical protein